MKISELLEWLRDRQANCIRIARLKTAKEREGWLEDAAYFQGAINAIAWAHDPTETVPAKEATDAR